MKNRISEVTMLSLKPGLDDLVIRELEPMIDATRQLNGCLIFDLYRLCEEPSTLILHASWNTRDAFNSFTLGPLRAEMQSVVSKFLAQPLRTWTVQEIF